MKKKKLILKNVLVLTLLVIAFASCEKDFNSIGSDIIGDSNFETSSVTYPVITYNQNITAVQTNNLPANMIGVNNNPVFGSYKADFVSQMAPSQFDVDFGENVVLDSVVLNIPYFNTITDTDDEGIRTFRVDSLFGDTPINLSIYRNNYFLRDFDPNSEFGEDQRYYSDKSLADGQFISPSDLEFEMLYQDASFFPSSDEIIFFELVFDEDGNPVLDEDGEQLKTIIARNVPSMRIRLDADDDNDDDTTVFQNQDYWTDLIINKEGQPELSNANNFADYFRGLYFKSDAIVGPDGNLIVMDFSSTAANITLYYTSDNQNTDGGVDEENPTVEGTYVINFAGNGVNFFDNNLITIPPGNQVDGDESLFLKGGEGAMAVVNLFNGDDEGSSDELDQFLSEFRKTDANGDFMTGNNGLFLTNRLINEANLIFYVNQNIMEGEEPDRLFIFDINNDNTVIDYLLDSTNDGSLSGIKVDHSHPLERVDEDDPTSEGIRYKIEITEHLNNILLRDSTNTKLGLLVTNSILAVERFNLQDDDNIVESIISGSILTPRGTVLYGNNAAEEDKKVKLEIYYTEPDN